MECSDGKDKQINGAGNSDFILITTAKWFSPKYCPLLYYKGRLRCPFLQLASLSPDSLSAPHESFSITKAFQASLPTFKGFSPGIS